MLADRGLKLDAVIRLDVDEQKLLGRIEKRAAEARAAGEKARADDNAAAFKTRLDAYHAQTAPLVSYYAGEGLLRSVDGMAPIDDVTREIAKVLDGAMVG